MPLLTKSKRRCHAHLRAGSGRPLVSRFLSRSLGLSVSVSVNTRPASPFEQICDTHTRTCRGACRSEPVPAHPLVLARSAASDAAAVAAWGRWTPSASRATFSMSMKSARTQYSACLEICLWFPSPVVCARARADGARATVYLPQGAS